MEEKMLRTLATLVLPSQILDYFTIVSVCEVGPEFHISLDERMDKTLSGDANFESKGFMEAVNSHERMQRYGRLQWIWAINFVH